MYYKKTKYENKQNTIQSSRHGLLQHRKREKNSKIYIYRSEVRLSSLRKSRGGGGAQKKTKYELRCAKPTRRGGGGGRGAEERTESAGCTEANGMEEDESGIHYLRETDGGPRSLPFFLIASISPKRESKKFKIRISHDLGGLQSP